MENATTERFLRRALLLDAVISAVTGLVMAGGASFLADLLALPAPLLRYAGLVLLPFAAVVAFTATRARVARGAVWAIVLVNALWALDSVALLLTGWVAPNLLGAGFILFQAAVVAGFAALQFLGLRRSVRPAL
jgi:hypothetical protein